MASARQSSPDQGSPGTGRSNEDHAERRRIQNRLNQRAFRLRQRAGEKVKQYKKRESSASTSVAHSRSSCESSPSGSGTSNAGADEEDTTSRRLGMRPSRAPSTARSSVAPSPSPIPRASHSPTAQDSWLTELVGDDLARVMNRNLIAAFTRNGRYLDIWDDALMVGTLGCIVEPPSRLTPISLQPVALQYQVPHDPIIDALPFAQFRHNILASIARDELDAEEFCRTLRSSGALVQCRGRLQHGGLVVWGDPDDVLNWELSEPFVEQWADLLLGCEDVLAATNLWRISRGEQPLTLPPTPEMLADLLYPSL